MLHVLCSNVQVKDNSVNSLGLNMRWGTVIILFWLAVLIAVLVLVRTLDYDHRTEDNALDWFEVFYRTGSIIYGGGQVGGRGGVV